MVEARGAQGEREREPKPKSWSALGFYPLILYLIPNGYISPHIYGEDPTWLPSHPNNLTYKQTYL